MNAFEQAGEARMLAEEGKIILGRAVLGGIKRLALRFHDWLVAMPTTLPPTDSFRR